jgi:hypothetical protein
MMILVGRDSGWYGGELSGKKCAGFPARKKVWNSALQALGMNLKLPAYI